MSADANLSDNPQKPSLILASTSRYRRELLERLRIPFTTVKPDVDESPLQDEAPIQTAQRLALAKALNVAVQHPTSVVIGSDQVADLQGQALGKPHTHRNAINQLQAMSGKLVYFHTAVAVAHTLTHFQQCVLSTVEVKFKTLTPLQIENYLMREQPYDCAGSAKSEGLGIALIEYIQSSDPTALIGLPLTLTCSLLSAVGLNPLDEA